MSGLVDAALRLGTRGWRVFPAVGKKPAENGWQEKATSDPALIRAAWQRHPNANPAIATGEGVYVLDADSAEAVDYLNSIGLDATLRVRTARGAHYYVSTPPDDVVTNASGQTIARGVDGRGSGGYVLGAGSLHPETARLYEWIDSTAELLPMPGEVLDRLTSRDVSAPGELDAAALERFAAAAQQLTVAERAELTGEASRAVSKVRQALGALPRSEGNGRGAKFYGHAHTLGEFVGAGVLSHGEAEEVLVGGAVTLCLDQDHDAYRSIHRGLAKGASQPAEPDLADFGPQTASSLHIGEGSSEEDDAQGSSSLPPGARAGTREDRYSGRRVDLAAELARPVEPKPWRCRGLLLDGALTIIAGKGGVGKSWALLELAHAVTTGDDVAGIECTRGPAIMIDGEMGRAQIVERVRTAGIGHGAVLYDATGLDLSKPEDVAWLRSVLDEHTDGKGGFMGIDSLRRLTPSKRENDSDDMAPVVSALATLARQTNVAIALLHHEGWETGRLRGSSAILDQADAVFSIRRPPASDDATGQLRRLTCRGDGGKMRFDREPEDVWFSISDNGRITSDAPESQEAKHRRAIIEALPSETKTVAAERCGTTASNSAWRSAWKALESEGLIAQHGGTWDAASLVPDPEI